MRVDIFLPKVMIVSFISIFFCFQVFHWRQLLLLSFFFHLTPFFEVIRLASFLIFVDSAFFVLLSFALQISFVLLKEQPIAIFIRF